MQAGTLLVLVGLTAVSCVPQSDTLDVEYLARNLGHEGAMSHGRFMTRAHLGEAVSLIDPAIAAQAVPGLIALLDDPDITVRTGAGRVLAIIGPIGRDAVPALRRALADSHPQMQWQAAAALARMSPDPDMVREIAELLEVPEIATDIADALAGLGPAAAPAVPSLVTALETRGLRWRAARALKAIGPAAEQALPALGTAWNVEERSTARETIYRAMATIHPGTIPPLDRPDTGAIVIPDLAELLAARDAAFAERLPPDSIAASLTRFLRELHDPDPEVRDVAARMLRHWADASNRGRYGHITVPALDSAARFDAVPKVRAQAVESLRMMFELGLPSTILGLDDPEPEVRRNAAIGLYHYGPRAIPAVPRLLSMFQDPDRDVRARVVAAVGAVYAMASATHPPNQWRIRQGQEMLPRLVPMLEDPDSLVRMAAFRAVHAVNPGEALRIATAASQDADPWWRVHAVKMFEDIAAPVTSGAALTALMSDPNAEVRRDAAYALRRALANSEGRRRPDSTTLAVLAQRLSDPEPTVRQAAAWALMDFDRDAAPAVPQLIAALHDPDAKTRSRAASALSGVGPAAASAVPDLLDLLSDEDDGVRWTTATALGKIGRQTDAVMDALRTTRTTDSSSEVREEAASALELLSCRWGPMPRERCRSLR